MQLQSSTAHDDHPIRMGFVVHDVARLRRTVFDKVLRTIGVTRSQWWVLANLSRHPGEPMMQTQLAVVMDLGKVTLGGLLDRLEVSGLVERKPVPGDRRAKAVIMTPRGAKLLVEMQRLAKDVNSQIMKGISRAEIDTAEKVLHDMKKQLLAMDAVPHHGSALQARAPVSSRWTTRPGPGRRSRRSVATRPPSKALS